MPSRSQRRRERCRRTAVRQSLLVFLELRDSLDWDFDGRWLRTIMLIFPLPRDWFLHGYSPADDVQYYGLVANERYLSIPFRKSITYLEDSSSRHGQSRLDERSFSFESFLGGQNLS